MTRTVDARGLACPQPVILARRALQEGGPVLTIVDDETAQRNVARMAEKAGATVTAEVRDDGVYLYISGGETPEEEAVSCEVGAAPVGGPLVLAVSSQYMGRGEHEELGTVLIRGFFHALGEVEPIPETIIFYNSGVKLAVAGSPVIEDLEALSERGIAILVCGTCLGYYQLQDQLAVGEVSNMYTIAETMLGAGRVVHV